MGRSSCGRAALRFICSSVSSSSGWWRATGSCRFIGRSRRWLTSDEGQRVEPEKPNGVKFERFIFDALPLARTVGGCGDGPGAGV